MLSELAFRLDEWGATLRAMALYQKVLDSDDPMVVGSPGGRLGFLHEQAGEYDAAAAAYRKVAGCGDPFNAVSALSALAEVLQKQGHHREAAESYQQVIDTAHMNYAPRAMYAKAELLRTTDPATAAHLYQQAINSHHFEATPKARQALNTLHGNPAHPELPDHLRPALGAIECYLVHNRDGVVEALWYQDAIAGSHAATSPDWIARLLRLNNLPDVDYHGRPDGPGGYLIRLTRP